MFSRIRGFLNRYKRKFIISGVIIGGVVLAIRYSQCKLREWSEKEVREMLMRSKRQQHFESTERTCNQTILSLATGSRESVTKALDIDAIVNKLRNGCDDKVVLWNTLKILAISRSAVIIYSHAMLVITLRIQLNLVGGYMFKDSQNPNGLHLVNSETLQKYLSLCEFFMDEGAEKLSAFIKEKVEEITASISLRDKLSLRDLEQIYWAVVSSVSADNSRDPAKNLASYMLPSNCENQPDNVLSKLTNEMLDLMESEEVQKLMHASVVSGFVLVIDHISEYFTETPVASNGTKVQSCVSLPGPSNRKDTFWTDSVEKPIDICYTDGYLNLNKISMPVAKIIPIINGQVPDVPTQGDVPSDWLQRLILNDKLKTFGANIYEAFSF